MQTLTKEWWIRNKNDHIFDRKWFDAFKAVDSRLILPDPLPGGAPDLGKMGVVFWHESDGKTIIPVGITYRDGDEFIFCYHPDYANDPDARPISITLPKTTHPYRWRDKDALLPYFDNLVSEGWLGMAQHNAYHTLENKGDIITDAGDFEARDDGQERYRRLLLFGRGFHGAISVVDVVAPDSMFKAEDQQVMANVESRTTIGGAQPKIPAVRRNGGFHAKARTDISTHIAKLRVPAHPGIIQNEYLNLVATRALMPEDVVAEATITQLKDYKDDALLITRFDRTKHKGRIHFEEALQIVGKPASMKYGLSYKDLADVTRRLTGEKGVETLFKRLLAQFLLGNTDSHFKNFAFWQQNGQWELTPNYDLVSTAQYKRSSMALGMGPQKSQMELKDIDPKRITILGVEDFGLDIDRIKRIVDELKSRIPAAREAVMADKCPYVADDKKKKFCDKMEGHAEHQLERFDRYYHIYKSKRRSAHLG